MATRRLQMEIDRVLKKVAEGVDTFNEIFQKIQTTQNHAQREKFEQDLKKEIKKLQRHRDQIKTWIGNNDIKDKRQLLENRRLIETQMEKFKACEREMKTKAYSKEGLGLQARVDPKERQKAEICDWISSTLETLQTQIDTMEAEQEALLAKRKRSDRLETIGIWIEGHKGHIHKLEVVLRMLQNDVVEVEKVTEIQELIDYYVENYQDEDYMDDETIYDDLNLEEEEELFGMTGQAGEEHHEDDSKEKENKQSFRDDESTSSASSTPAAKRSNSKSKGTSAPSTPNTAKDEKKPKKEILLPEVALTHSGAQAGPTITSMVATEKGHSAARERDSDVPPNVSDIPNAWHQNKKVRAARDEEDKPKRRSNEHDVASASSHPPIVTSAASGTHSSGFQSSFKEKAATAAARDPDVKTRVSSQPQPVPRISTKADHAKVFDQTGRDAAPEPSHKPQPSVIIPSKKENPQTASGASRGLPNTPVLAHHSGVPKPVPQPAQQKAPLPQAHSKSPDLGRPEPEVDTMIPPFQQPSLVQQVTAPADSEASAGAETLRKTPEAATPAQEDQLPPSLADLVASFEAAKERAFGKLAEDGSMYILDMLETSLQHTPTIPKAYTPTNPYPAPTYYPQQPSPQCDALFPKFDLDTLFFVFYYEQGSYRQYLAARELKLQSWRFHKKYLTWFQRHEEPKQITEEYEYGTYIYFDYEGAWCQRKKSEFRFEYRYLEDTGI